MPLCACFAVGGVVTLRPAARGRTENLCPWQRAAALRRGMRSAPVFLRHSSAPGSAVWIRLRPAPTRGSCSAPVLLGDALLRVLAGGREPRLAIESLDSLYLTNICSNVIIQTAAYTSFITGVRCCLGTAKAPAARVPFLILIIYVTISIFVLTKIAVLRNPFNKKTRAFRRNTGFVGTKTTKSSCQSRGNVVQFNCPKKPYTQSHRLGAILEVSFLYIHDNITPAKSSRAKDDLVRAQEKKQRVETAAHFAGFHLSDIGKHRMETCGDWLQMLENDTGDKRKIERGFFCGSRWCPACAWRYAAAWGRILMAVDRYLCAEQQLVPIFVTLTVPNVEADKLRETLEHMAASWKRLMQRKAFSVWKNFVRKTEVTYNAESDTYHPHYHVMIWVKPGYFGKSGGYISHDRLLQDWRDACGIPNITQVDIRRCKSAEQDGAAVAEVAKYVAKSSDFLLSQDVFDTFYAGLHNVRIMSLGGEAKKAVQLFRAGKLDKYDSEQPDDLAEYVWRVVYGWVQNSYQEMHREAVDLTAEAAARRIHAEMRAADMAAMTQGFSELTGKTYHIGGRKVVTFTPVFSPWEEGVVCAPKD